MSFIRVQGNQFINEETGEPFVFRGLDFSDPDKLEKDGHWNKEYFEKAKEWGANVVRFAVHPRAWRERGEEEYLKLIDQGIQWAEELNLYVIIDWHSIGNLRNELFQDPMYITTKNETLKFWQTIAERYKGNPTVAMYEVFNEPTLYNGELGRMTWPQWKEILKDIITVIYAHDRDVIPLVAGFNWAYELTHFHNDPLEIEGIAYGTHPYPQKSPQLWVTNWEANFGFAANEYPVIATEFGFMSEDKPGAHIPVLGDGEYGRKIIDYFEEKGISWTIWCFDPDWSPQLIKNWDFEPTTQGAFFKKELEKLNQ